MVKPAFSPQAWSIKARFRALFIGLSVLMAVGFILVAAVVNRSTGIEAERSSSQVISEQVRLYLEQVTQQSAELYDLSLESVKNDAGKLADFAATVFQNEDMVEVKGFWKADDHMKRLPDGQYGNSTSDYSSVYVPKTQTYNQPVIDDIELSAFLDPLLGSIYKSNTDIEAIYYASPRNIIRYYPNVNLAHVLPDDFQAVLRPWYEGSLLINNPSKQTWWTAPYIDATGLGLVTTAAAPIFNNQGRLLGVIGIDLTLNNLRMEIEAAKFPGNGYFFLIDPTGHAIAMPEQGFHDFFSRSASPSDVYVDMNKFSDQLKDVINDMKAGQSGSELVSLETKEILITYTKLNSTGWSLASVVDTTIVLGEVASLQAKIRQVTQNLITTQILPVSAVILSLVIILGFSLTNRVINPLKDLTEQASRLGSGDYSLSLPVHQNDEIGILARTMQSMAGKIKMSVQQLEERIEQRTQELHVRTEQLNLAAKIAGETASIRDLDMLLQHSVNLIQERFNIYHAGIFLLDEAGEYAILRSATGEAGRALLANHHRLKVGEVGIVGFVTATGKPHIANNVDIDPAHYKNPYLPDTRSEMALPLKLGNQIIGALDVQSIQNDAFKPEDIQVMHTLADQIAVAIDNARLFNELQTTLRQLEKTYTESSKASWRARNTQAAILGYEYIDGDIKPIYQAENKLESSSLSITQMVKVPIALRDKIIAVIDVEPGPTGLDSEGIALVEAVSERVSRSLESAHLYDFAQKRAASEKMVSRITMRMRETLDVETILRTFALELRKSLDLSEIEIKVGKPKNPVSPHNGSKES